VHEWLGTTGSVLDVPLLAGISYANVKRGEKRDARWGKGKRWTRRRLTCSMCASICICYSRKILTSDKSNAHTIALCYRDFRRFRLPCRALRAGPTHRRGSPSTQQLQIRRSSESDDPTPPPIPCATLSAGCTDSAHATQHTPFRTDTSTFRTQSTQPPLPDTLPSDEPLDI
jgi:hypothetical protein